MSEIVEIIGRWARLANGDFVTPVPPFSDFGYDDRAFDAAIAEFQRDPVAALGRGVVDRVEPTRTPGPNSREEG
jgi:hypothetical protein